MLHDWPTADVLRGFFGLCDHRGVKRVDFRAELVRRGVSVVAVEEAVDNVMWAVGCAADNRIPEVDDNND
jgi:hypothetical protein